MKSNKYLIVAFTIVAFFIGGVIGYYVKNIPILEFDSKIGISAILSILGLIVTIFIMPFIIDDRKNREAKINDTALKDLDLICVEVLKIRDFYESFLKRRKLTIADKTEILCTFKRVSSLLYMLSGRFNQCGILNDFKEKVIDVDYKTANEACTEKLMTNTGLSNDEIKEALAKLDGLYCAIKRTRYELFDK